MKLIVGQENIKAYVFIKGEFRSGDLIAYMCKDGKYRVAMIVYEIGDMNILGDDKIV